MKSETMKKVTEGIVRGHVLDTAGCTDKAADELEKCWKPFCSKLVIA